MAYRKWTSEDKELLFTILSRLKKKRNIQNLQDYKSSHWAEDCKETSSILTVLLDEEIRPGQVEGQTILPNFETRAKFSKSTAEAFAYGILNGYVTTEELNSIFLGR